MACYILVLIYFFSAYKFYNPDFLNSPLLKARRVPIAATIMVCQKEAYIHIILIIFSSRKISRDPILKVTIQDLNCIKPNFVFVCSIPQHFLLKGFITQSINANNIFACRKTRQIPREERIKCKLLCARKHSSLQQFDVK
jgi:hypothetical protein